MEWTYRKINKRNKLFGIMTYQIACDLPGFFDAREWCWEQWGPGIEHEHFINHQFYTKREMPWAWDCSKYHGASISNGSLYLRDEEQMSWFSLRWS